MQANHEVDLEATPAGVPDAAGGIVLKCLVQLVTLPPPDIQAGRAGLWEGSSGQIAGEFR